jgi:hypothetical protein
MGMRVRFLAASLLLVSCTAVPAQEVEPAREAAPSAPFEMRRFADGMNRWRFTSDLTERAQRVIRSEAEWEDFWDGLNRQQSYAPVPDVDFEREMLLIAAMGARPTGGYVIEIASAVERADAIEVRVVETSPGRLCGTTQAVTEPADIVRVTRSAKPVRWVEQERVSDCR